MTPRAGSSFHVLPCMGITAVRLLGTFELDLENLRFSQLVTRMYFNSALNHCLDKGSGLRENEATPGRLTMSFRELGLHSVMSVHETWT